MGTLARHGSATDKLRRQTQTATGGLLLVSWDQVSAALKSQSNWNTRDRPRRPIHQRYFGVLTQQKLQGEIWFEITVRHGKFRV
jgi:hypothetical protein